MKTSSATGIVALALLAFLSPRPIAAGEAGKGGFVLESLDVEPSGQRFDVAAIVKNASGRAYYDVSLRLTITDGSRPLGTIVLPKVAVFPSDATMEFAENSGHALGEWTTGYVEVALEGGQPEVREQPVSGPKAPVPLRPNPEGFRLRDLRLVNDGGQPRVSGTLTNRSGQSRVNTRFTLYFYDADQYLLGAVSLGIALFPSGGDVRFLLAAPPQIEGWATWILYLHPQADYEIEDFAAIKTGRDWRVTGELRNNTTKHYGMAQLVLKFYDADGFLITKNNLLVRNLYAGGSVPITVVTNRDLGKMAGYELEEDMMAIGIR